MGSGASSNRKTRIHVIQALPGQDPLRQRTSHRRSSRDSSNSPTAAKSHKRPRPEESEWPLPETDSGESFTPKWPSNYRDRYSVKKAYHLKAKSVKRIKLSEERSKDREFHQKETSLNQWKHHNSTIHDSAHVQSSIQTQSHACINLSTTQEIDDLLSSLTKVQEQLDLNIEERGKIISEQLKVIIDMIVNDTRDVQQNLLAYAKEQQSRQDDLYNKWLQRYVAELDKWKSARLAKLQADLQQQQHDIMQSSQQFIMEVNQEANMLRGEVLKEEQRNASEVVAEITEKIQNMSTHQLGTETMTRINLIVHGNVGTKAPGQDCKFDFDHPTADNNHSSGTTTAKPGTSKTTSTSQPSKTSEKKPKKPTAASTTIRESTVEDVGDDD